MKPTKQFLTFALMAFIIMLGCQKDDNTVIAPDPTQQEPENPDGSENPTTGEFKTIDVKIELPEESTIHLENTELSTLFVDTPVNADGITTAPFNSESPEIAFLMDAEDNVVLAGFLRGQEDTISLESTAQVLLYFSLGSTFLPYEVKEKFIAEINNFPAVLELSNRLRELAKQDALFLEKGSFREILAEELAKITKLDTLDFGANKLAVNGADIRSGLQLTDIDFQNMTITNTYRRRAHAFIYKTAYKDLDGNEHIIDDEISGGDQAFKEVPIKPASGIRGFISTLDKYAQGKAMDFAETVTDPITLPLENDYEECTYEVRIVGPYASVEGANETAFTNAESDKLLQLSIETFALDILLPAILDLNGHKKLLKGNVPKERLDAIASVVKAALGSVPGATENIKKGNYRKALEDFIFTMYTKWSASEMKNFLEPIVSLVGAVADETKTGGYFSRNIDVIANKTKHFNKFIKFLDNSLKASDYARIAYSLSSSKNLEIWKVKAEKADILLTPEQQTTLPGRFTDFEVLREPKPNEGAVLQYEWSTTGKYGVIRDNATHEGTSFTSSKDKISYITNVPSDQLSDNDNIDEITVTVSIKMGNQLTKVGTETAKVNVKKFKYEIKPDGVTVQGGTLLRLHIENSVGDALVDNDVYESKVVWSTSGTYGKFYGVQNQVTLEKTGTYTISYEALDKEVKRGTETFIALIYRKQKTDSEYLLWEKAEATINIENDPLKDIFYVPNEVIDELWAGGPGRSITTAYTFEPRTYPDKEVVSYSLRIVEQDPDPIGCVGRGKTWNPANAEADLAT